MGIGSAVQIVDSVVGLAAGAFGVALWFIRKRRTIAPVQIRVRKIVGPESRRTTPEVLIATYTGYELPPGMDADEFSEALQKNDLSRLPVHEGIKGIGLTVRAIKAYPTLKRVYLITTTSQQGRSSLDSVGLLRTWLSSSTGQAGVEVLAGEEYSVLLDEDDDVADASYRVTKSILESLKREGKYKPAGSRILVDVTGGVRSMSVGTLLACIRPDQDVQLVGVPYDVTGKPDHGRAFPMVIGFKVAE
jgi:hypothetical protein